MGKKYKRIFLFLLCMGILLWFLIMLKPTRHETWSAILSGLRESCASLVYLRGNGCDMRIYADMGKGKENLIAVLSLTRKYDEDIYAFYITESGYWLGYNLSPYCKYVVWAVDFGRIYGVDEVKPSTRERLAEMARKLEGVSGYSLYGSVDIKEPPPYADDKHLYKVSDNAVWLHLPFE